MNHYAIAIYKQDNKYSESSILAEMLEPYLESPSNRKSKYDYYFIVEDTDNILVMLDPNNENNDMPKKYVEQIDWKKVFKKFDLPDPLEKYGRGNAYITPNGWTKSQKKIEKDINAFVKHEKKYMVALISYHI